jgi:hypothetical protein
VIGFEMLQAGHLLRVSMGFVLMRVLYGTF